MHGRAVVPDHEVMLCPAMDVDELRLRRVFHQVADEGHGLGPRPADDGADMGGEQQRLAARDRVRAHQPVQHRLHAVAFLVGEVGEAQLAARIDQRMLADQVLDLGLGRVVERVVGGAHVGELGVAAIARHDAAAQQRVACRHDAEGGIRMPQPVAERGHAAPVVAFETLVVLVEIGDVGEGLAQSHRGRRQGGVGAFLQGAEVAREGELLFVGHVLAGQDQHGIPVHAGLDGRDIGRRQRSRHVDAGHPGGEVGLQRLERTRLDRQRHLPWVRSPSAGRPRCYHRPRS